LRVLSIGTFYKTKGFDTLIAACALLKEQRFAFECKIVGDGPERERLQALIARRELQNEVRMLGYLKHEELRPLRLWASVFILLPRPYLHWGIPNVYIEALATRLPVIATPLNAITELIQPERTGTLVECDNAAAAAAALREAHRHPERHARMALAGQKLVAEKFDARRTIPQVIVKFHEAIAAVENQNSCAE
jgi:glycosyltransferase involved in cell wall biosynthesis